jgi:glucosamine kinase
VPYYLGIDGGGSKTTCTVGDDTTILATATAGPSNVVRVGEAQARESLHLAIRQACAAAGITPAQVAQTCIGAAGAARPQIAGIVRRALAEILSPPIEVVGDLHIALEAAFDAGPGVIVNAGTGSFAYGRDAQGNTGRVGGWGFAISDEGSAHWIGRSAIMAVLRAADEQGTRDQASAEKPSQLSRALMNAWTLDSLNDLAAAGNSTAPPDFAALFPAVLASADAGDGLAQSVLTRAGTELARLAEIAIRRLFPDAPSPSLAGGSASPAPDAAVPLAMSGGVFRHASLVRQVFYNEVVKLEARAQLNPLVVDPVEGALRLARKPPRLT